MANGKWQIENNTARNMLLDVYVIILWIMSGSNDTTNEMGIWEKSGKTKNNDNKKTRKTLNLLQITDKVEFVFAIRGELCCTVFSRGT